MAKPPGKCIFCGGFGLTKEHVFPDWLRQIFPRLPTDTHTMGVLSFPSAQRGFIRKRGQGQLGSKKVRVVCKACNNGWLSEMEGDTQGILRPLILGTTRVLTINDQARLAAWITKTTMIVEYLVREQPAIRQAERERFREQKRPEDHWQIAVSFYVGRQWSKGGIFHHGLGVYIPPEQIRVGVRNTQFTILGLGRLICMSISSTAQGFSVAPNDEIKLVTRQLCPLGGRDLPWPSDKVLDDNGVQALASAFGRALNLAVPKF